MEEALTEICESCGMPLEKKTTSKHDSRYCIYCQDQDTGELASYQEVREGSIKAAMRVMGKNREEAVLMTDETLPHLPRWYEERKRQEAKKDAKAE